jgi:hypothetical protein
MGTDYKDALATIRGEVLDAVAITSPETGLRASPEVELLLDTIMGRLESPAICWALREMADHNSPKT